MSAASSKSAYLHGIVVCVPFVLVAMPFGLLFGVVGAEAGLDLLQVMAFSTVVIAGAAQFTAVQLMTEAAPIALVLLSALAVNMRMMMYSASLQPHVGRAALWQRVLIAYTTFDNTYAISMSTFDDAPSHTTREKAWFFLGTATPMVPAWIASTWIGAVLGTNIPDAWAIEFAMPVLFLSLIGPALRSLAHIAAALTAIVLALAFAWLPFNLGLIVAALPAMAVGAELERRGFGR
ncbi:MAG: AzlC family ABC transporter permease [Pseudomonadota bacterium]